MKFRIETQNRLLRRVAPVRDDELINMAQEGGSRAFLEEVTSMPYRPAAKPSFERPHRNTETRGGRSLRARRTLFKPILVGAVVLALFLGFAVTGVLWSEPVAAGVKITTRNGYYVARVTDPEASSEQMSAAFDQLGLDIELRLVPVSPTLVGTVVAIGDDGGEGIETLRDDDRCISGGGSCPVGLRIPLDYSGSAEITLGRSARQGEEYLSVADALAPGEALHCSGLYGAPVERVLTVLNERNLTATFHALVEREGRQFSEEVDASEVQGWYVRDTLPWSKDHVVVQVSREAPPSAPSWYEETIQKGCG